MGRKNKGRQSEKSLGRRVLFVPIIVFLSGFFLLLIIAPATFADGEVSGKVSAVGNHEVIIKIEPVTSDQAYPKSGDKVQFWVEITGLDDLVDAGIGTVIRIEKETVYVQVNGGESLLGAKAVIHAIGTLSLSSPTASKPSTPGYPVVEASVEKRPTTPIRYSNDVSTIDYTSPESVSMAFLDAVKYENYEIIPLIVAPTYQHLYTPEAIKKGLGNIKIPDNPELKVHFKRNGQKAEVAVVGTTIGLELHLVEGRWFLEY